MVPKTPNASQVLKNEEQRVRLERELARHRAGTKVMAFNPYLSLFFTMRGTGCNTNTRHWAGTKTPEERLHVEEHNVDTIELVCRFFFFLTHSFPPAKSYRALKTHLPSSTITYKSSAKFRELLLPHRSSRSWSTHATGWSCGRKRRRSCGRRRRSCGRRRRSCGSSS
jgi:hypothetical protein